MIDSGRPCRGGAPVLALHRQLSPINAGSWDFRWVPVCSSTEILLKQWLLQSPLMLRPRVVAARQQRWGVGQRGRVWRAPKGGVWLSAALPVVSDGPNPNNTGAGLLGLALALSLAERLEHAGVSVQIKWPNDLLASGRKLAGLLPGLVQRGNHLRLLRCGVGLNVCNAVPVGAAAVREFLPAATPELWTAEVLLALEACPNKLKDPENLIAQVQKRLWADRVHDPAGGGTWHIDGLTSAGGLRVQRGDECREWIRWP